MADHVVNWFAAVMIMAFIRLVLLADQILFAPNTDGPFLKLIDVDILKLIVIDFPGHSFVHLLRFDLIFNLRQGVVPSIFDVDYFINHQVYILVLVGEPLPDHLGNVLMALIILDHNL